MSPKKNNLLIIAAILDAVAAILHLACIYFGAPLFRFLGTEEMARMYEAGHFLHPIIACMFLATVLFIWAAYALSGAGVIRKLPFLRLGLIAITLVYFARAFAFPLLAPYFPENSQVFWYCSSLIVFIFGLFHLLGLKQVWFQLSAHK